MTILYDYRTDVVFTIHWLSSKQYNDNIFSSTFTVYPHFLLQCLPLLTNTEEIYLLHISMHFLGRGTVNLLREKLRFIGASTSRDKGGRGKGCIGNYSGNIALH